MVSTDFVSKIIHDKRFYFLPKKKTNMNTKSKAETALDEVANG